MTVILGAGLAGLSLARGLVEAGERGPITLVDRRTAYANDRTWCFWRTDPEPRWAGTPHHLWHRWRMVGRGGEVVEHVSEQHPYVQVRADDFYAASVERLAAAPNVELQLGTRVLGVEEAPAWPRSEPTEDEAAAQLVRTIRTSSGELASATIFDAMGGHGPLDAGTPTGAIELLQSFLGLEIETTRPVFDPQVATLMDFRCGPGPDRDFLRGGRAGGDGLHFVYVLPTSPTRALVEHTTLGPGTVPAAVRREAIATYLADHWGLAPTQHEVIREERGVLPMSTRVHPLDRGPGIRTVGTAAGGIRPSSGYGFVRIQRHAQALAEATVHATPLPAMGSSRHAVLDQLFLRALAVDPRGFDRTLLALARGTSADAFARFMGDASTVRDEAAVMRSLVRPGFLMGMAASSLLRPIAR